MIDSVIVGLLKSDSYIISKLSTFSGGAAVFSDVVPESAKFPNMTVRCMQISVRPHIKVFNVYIDYWDHNANASRKAARDVANHIENKLDGYRHTGEHDIYSDLRFRLLSGYAATREEYNGIHYNLFFGVRACRKQWSETSGF